MTRKLIALLVLTLAASLPAFAYEYIADCRGGVRWNNSTITWRPSVISFPSGGPWYQSLDAARLAWNSYTPGTNYRIAYTWDTNTSYDNNDGRNSIVMPSTWPFDSNWLAVTFMRRSMCYVWPGPDADWVEGDMVFNPYPSWENSANPATPISGTPPFNSTLTAIHEHGHGLGLDHENDIVASLNAIYPFGGPIGNNSNAHPHADDVRGDRALYGTSATQRDVSSSAYRLTSTQGVASPIPAPGSTNRNAPLSFQFTVENRGTTDQSSVPVYFYLTPSRNSVSTASYYIGSATLSLNAGTVATPTAYVTIPAGAPTGYQYIGWVVDPYNGITESDETNNGVTLTGPTLISTNRAPSACISATPTSGRAPLYVSFSATCSTDADGNALTYLWDFGDGSYDTAAVTDHWYDSGFYEVTLTVTDSNGASSVTYVEIYVAAQCDGIRCAEEPL